MCQRCSWEAAVAVMLGVCCVPSAAWIGPVQCAISKTQPAASRVRCRRSLPHGSVHTAVTRLNHLSTAGRRSHLARWCQQPPSENPEDFEIVTVTEETALEDWVGRGFDPEQFTVEAMVEIWEAEDAQILEGEDMDSAEVDRRMDAEPFSKPSERPASGQAAVLSDSEIFPEDPVRQPPRHAQRVKTRIDGVEVEAEGKGVGIDLGTTNSAIALIEGGKAVMVPNNRGKRTTPSVVAYRKAQPGDPAADEDGLEVLVGEAAQEHMAVDPLSVVSHVKRIIGRTRTEAKKAKIRMGVLGVDQTTEVLSMKCAAAGRPLPPEEVSAQILGALIEDAERYMGGGVRVKRAIVTVPAYFTDPQCDATREAGRLAGLERVKLLREPEAAALAYGMDKDVDELILVFDLGGGTFDVSVLEVGRGVVEVIATCGNSYLGGNDFDQSIVQWMADEVVRSGSQDPRNNPAVMAAMLRVAEQARIKLTNSKEVEVYVPSMDGFGGLSTQLTRPKMESLCQQPLQEILQPLREVAIMAGVTLPGETGALMAPDEGDTDGAGGGGGSGPSLRQLRRQQGGARKKAQQAKDAVRKQRQEMSQVARGMTGDSSGKLRAFPQGRPLDRVVLVGGATRMPCVRRLVAAVTGVEPRTSVNPDEAVALGAALYAGVIDGEVQGLEVMSAWEAALYRLMAQRRSAGQT